MQLTDRQKKYLADWFTDKDAESTDNALELAEDLYAHMLDKQLTQVDEESKANIVDFVYQHLERIAIPSIAKTTMLSMSQEITNYFVGLLSAVYEGAEQWEDKYKVAEQMATELNIKCAERGDLLQELTTQLKLERMSKGADAQVAAENLKMKDEINDLRIRLQAAEAKVIEAVRPISDRTYVLPPTGSSDGIVRKLQKRATKAEQENVAFRYLLKNIL